MLHFGGAASRQQRYDNGRKASCLAPAADRQPGGELLIVIAWLQLLASMNMFEVNSDSGDVRWTCRSRASSFRSMRRATTRCPPVAAAGCVPASSGILHNCSSPHSCSVCVTQLLAWLFTSGLWPGLHRGSDHVRERAPCRSAAPADGSRGVFLRPFLFHLLCQQPWLWACVYIGSAHREMLTCSSRQGHNGAMPMAPQHPWRIQRKMCTMCMCMPVRSLGFIPNNAM